MIVVTIFALWFSVFSNDEIEGFVSFFFIFTFGILHGSNDIKLIQVSAEKSKGKYHKMKVFGLYVMTVLLILLIFSFFPALALIFFLLISGFHFGEQHWNKKLHKKAKWDILLFTFYGLFILFMIFCVKHEQASPIIYDISGFALEKNNYLIATVIIGILLLLQLAVYFYFNLLKANIWEELFYLLVFFIIFRTASLLWGFCIYFVVWHSIPSLVDQMNYLYGASNKMTFLKYLKSSWMYWVISLVGLFGLYFLLRENTQFFTSILLYFLAAITFPHVIVMSRLED
ncbi:Brp/Blh family beta-carotene 15,15'-dioxygenase [Flagellimonas sp. HMM57]|uniref:Brp/Blh family beta-carotene 15,15'-dioxygenase n=1 Tax=unclassified Flagellimonas TaxID=2644544 RepID=UPI0013D5F063|nr:MULTISPECIES: Brp/Blh family beta-carotene 15,15'-dioxygenase [unclassified Flagellimonas]UII74982.1 Brp/Blh family beta-carotene 15,15'-dioxygenase [Flagellimonas sp. HMM57]